VRRGACWNGGGRAGRTEEKIKNAAHDPEGTTTPTNPHTHTRRKPPSSTTSIAHTLVTTSNDMSTRPISKSEITPLT
jgi:hypothetical protein